MHIPQLCGPTVVKCSASSAHPVAGSSGIVVLDVCSLENRGSMPVECPTSQEDAHPRGTHFPCSKRDNDHCDAQGYAWCVRNHESTTAKRHTIRSVQQRLGPAQPQERYELKPKRESVERHIEFNQLLERQNQEKIDANVRKE